MGKSNSKMRVIGYVRASTQEQLLSPQAQEEALRRWCAAHGAKLLAVHFDKGISGGAPLEKRLGFLNAVEDVKLKKAEVLLVAKRDRIARDVIIAAMCERMVESCDGKLVSADGVGAGDGPEAQLMRRVVDAVAEYERAIIRARTRAALRVKKARGQRTGQVPFGYQLAEDGVHLEEDREEQGIIRDIAILKKKGCSYKEIARRLTECRVKARGERWHPTTVRRILVRELERSIEDETEAA